MPWAHTHLPPFQPGVAYLQARGRANPVLWQHPFFGAFPLSAKGEATGLPASGDCLHAEEKDRAVTVRYGMRLLRPSAET